ncbi:RibD family protein [Henriciella aquimarina]|uniref:RibD family protein n=1 Tax=Henriciella aquimarina TaxID=545261 RepID=UPI0009FBDFDE|nr:RibD family protein [Henriciella aquimarina]
MSSRASVTLKIATSLDARIALSNGTSQWITSPQARARAHQMRAEHDAVLVGVGTVLADDPLLTARTVPLPKRQPVRIVADSQVRTPPASRLAASTATGRVVIAHADPQRRATAKGFQGVDFWPVGDGHGRVAPQELLRRARAEGINRIFLEGGGQLAASFLAAGLVDRIEWFRAPIIIGGDGLPAIAALGLDKMSSASRWQLSAYERIGDDSLESWISG